MLSLVSKYASVNGIHMKMCCNQLYPSGKEKLDEWKLLAFVPYHYRLFAIKKEDN